MRMQEAVNSAESFRDEVDRLAWCMEEETLEGYDERHNMLAVGQLYQLQEGLADSLRWAPGQGQKERVMEYAEEIDAVLDVMYLNRAAGRGSFVSIRDAKRAFKSMMYAIESAFATRPTGWAQPPPQAVVAPAHSNPRLRS